MKIVFNCPNCWTNLTLHYKEEKSNYSYSEVPFEIAKEIKNEKITCEKCNTTFKPVINTVFMNLKKAK